MLHGLNFVRQQYSNLSKPGGANQSAINTITTLADRLLKADETNLSIEDRRAAVLALKGLSRDHNKAVGEHALAALLKSLQRDAGDEDTARALIECCITLCEVPSSESAPAGAGKRKTEGPQAGTQHTDVFLSEPGPLHCLLPLLAPDRAFYTRFASLQLLGSLLRNRPHRVQDHVLVAPGGCGAILECLAEGAGSSAEIVRNEALLLLPHLVYGNADIQKLVAFEGAFEKLLDVCAAEGRIEGGVIVQDALDGLEALLRYNVSNQNYFRETLSIPMLAPLLFYPPTPPPASGGHAEQEYARQLEAFAFQDWDNQKVSNAKVVLDIVGLLVRGQGEGRRANQGSLLQCGMTKCLLDLGLGSTAPGSLKSQALHVVGSLMHQSRANQDLLSSLLIQPVRTVSAPQLPKVLDAEGAEELAPELTFTRAETRPAVVCLVETAIGTAGAKGGLGLRAAAVACFRSYVDDNMDARLGIINGMAPSEREEKGAAPAGKVLLEAITQNPSQAATDQGDAYKHLISAMLLSYLVRGSETAKTAARSIAIQPDGSVVKHIRNDDDEDEDDDAPSSLIQVIVGNLTLGERELADAVRKERASAMGATISSSSYSAADWTRIMVGYLVLLSVWLHGSPLSVRDFLSESATLQAVIQPVAQSSGVDPLIQGLAAFLLGVAYEFDTDPGNSAVTRATMHPILHSRIGADQFAVRIGRVEDDVRFREVTPDVLEKLILLEEQSEAEEERLKQLAEARAAAAAAAAAATAAKATDRSAPAETTKEVDEKKADEEAQDKDLEVNGLGHLSKRRRGGLWFDWNFVEFWRSHSTLIAKSVTIDPASSSAAQAALPAELLDAQRQAEALRDTVAKQAREIEVMEKRVEELTSTHAAQVSDLQAKLEEAQKAVAAHTPQLEAAQRELEQVKSSHATAWAEVQGKHESVAKELEETKAKEEDAQSKILQLTGEIARVSGGKPSQKEFEKLQKELEGVKRKHEDLLASSSAGGDQVKDLMEARELASQRATRIEELEAQLSTASSGASSDLQTQLDAALKEKAGLEAQLASAAPPNGEAEEKVKELESKLSASTAAAATAAEEGKELQAKLDAVLKAKTEMDGKVVELEEARERVKQLESQAEAAGGEGAKQVKELQEQLARFGKEKKELEGKVGELEKVTKEKSEMEEKLKKLEIAEKDKSELEKKLKDMDKVIKEKEGLEKKVKDLESVKKQKSEMEEKLKKLESAQKEKVDLEKKVKDLEKVTKEKKDLELKLKDLEKVTKEKKELETKVKDLDKLTKEKADLQKQVDKLSKLEKEKKDLESKVTAATKEKKDLETKLTKEKADLQAQLDKLKSSSSPPPKGTEELQKEKEELSKENEDLLVLLEELTQKRKADKAKLRSKGEEVSDDDEDDDDEEGEENDDDVD